MNNQELAQMTGQASNTDRPVAYKLNEVRFNGDSADFSLVRILDGKGEDNKFPVIDLGKNIKGVIIKMRWRLFKYEEMGGMAHITSTSEYDNKNTDKIVVFGTNEKGLAADIKEKYKLGSQRVLYTYIPSLKEVVRIVVKASALSNDKNPEIDGNKELGLFEYVDSFTKDKLFMHEFITEFSGVWREDIKNKRKSYFAMSFKRGKEIEEANKLLIADQIKEVHEKTTRTPFADEYVPPTGPAEETINYPVDEYTGDEINPDDIPF